MSQTKGKIIDHFYGGIIRDEKTRIDGAALNVEELDIFENANFVRAAQVMSTVAVSSSSPSASPSNSPSGSNSASPSSSPSSSPSASASGSPSNSPSSSPSSSPSASAGFLDITYVGGTTGTGTGSPVTVSLTSLASGSDSSPSDGDLVVLAFAYHRNSADVDMAPTTTGYTEVSDLWANDASDTNLYVGYKRMGASPDTQVVVPAHPSGSDYPVTVAVQVWRGTRSGAEVYGTQTATGINGSGADPASITPTYSDSVILAIGAGSQLGSSAGENLSFISLSSGYYESTKTNLQTSNASGAIGICSKQWYSGAENPGAFTPSVSSANGSWTTATLALRPAIDNSASSSPSSSASSSPSASVYPQTQQEINAYTGDTDDNVWGYAVGDSDEVVLFKVEDGGSDDPGMFDAVNLSGDTTNLAFPQSPIAFFKSREASNPNSLYYLKKNGTSIYLARYNIDLDLEQRWNGSAWTDTGALDANTKLTGLNGSHDRYFMRVEFGELYIGNGNYIAKVDDEGTFTEQAFQLPTEWEAVDITFVSDVGLILARNINRFHNQCKAYWWDLTSTVQFDNVITIPHGGPQWIVNFKERIYALCAQNGKARFYTSVASPGVPLVQIPGMELADVAVETSDYPISAPKMVAMKDNVLYFGLHKDDKSGIYAIGNIDEDKPTALVLAKRFDTTDYSRHTPIALHTQGPNFYASYLDNGAFKHSRCESNNNPDRSSNAIYESVVFDEGDPTKNKDVSAMIVTTKPLPSGTSVSGYIKADYGSYSQVYEADGTSFDTTSKLIGNFRGKSITGKTHQYKFQLTSNGPNSPIVTGIAYVARVHDLPAYA